MSAGRRDPTSLPQPDKACQNDVIRLGLSGAGRRVQPVAVARWNVQPVGRPSSPEISSVAAVASGSVRQPRPRAPRPARRLAWLARMGRRPGSRPPGSMREPRPWRFRLPSVAAVVAVSRLRPRLAVASVQSRRRRRRSVARVGRWLRRRLRVNPLAAERRRRRGGEARRALLRLVALLPVALPREVEEVAPPATPRLSPETTTAWSVVRSCHQGPDRPRAGRRRHCHQPPTRRDLPPAMPPCGRTPAPFAPCTARWTLPGPAARSASARDATAGWCSRERRER